MCCFFKTNFRKQTSDRKRRFALSEIIFKLRKNCGILKERPEARQAIVQGGG